MPIIRRKLDPNTVYPEDIRYNSDTDTVQSNVNGDWVDNPQADPRTQTTFPPRVTADTRCDAAESVKDAIKLQIDGVLEAIDNAATLFTIASIILSIFTFGVYAIFISLAIGIGNQMLTIGTGAITAALTEPVYHTFACILYCRMDGNGRLDEGSFAAVLADVNSQIGGVGATIINAMLQLAGFGGVNNLASIGTSAGDCADCGCPTPCDDPTLFEKGNVISVTDNGDGTVTFRVETVPETGSGIPIILWGNRNAVTDQCCIFVNVVEVYGGATVLQGYIQCGQPPPVVINYPSSGQCYAALQFFPADYVTNFIIDLTLGSGC